jgi:hypothetical protein
MMHNLANISTWKKLIYALGFTPPSDNFAKADYKEYLATLNEVPSGTQGIDPNSFFPWLKETGRINNWQYITLVPGLVVETIHTAMVGWDGALLVLSLTQRAYNEGLSAEPWTLESGEVPNPSLGHAIASVVYGPNDFGIVTWGMMKSMSDEFCEACVYGCYVFN